MNDLLAVTANGSVGLLEVAPTGRATNSDAADEPKVLFEDTPALARIRAEQRADKNRRKEAETQEAAVQPAPEGQDCSQSEKTSENTIVDRKTHPRGDDGKASVAKQQGANEGQSKGEAAQELGSGLRQAVGGQSETVAEAGHIQTSDKAQVSKQAGATHPHKPGQVQEMGGRLEAADRSNLQPPSYGLQPGPSEVVAQGKADPVILKNAASVEQGNAMPAKEKGPRLVERGVSPELRREEAPGEEKPIAKDVAPDAGRASAKIAPEKSLESAQAPSTETKAATKTEPASVDKLAPLDDKAAPRDASDASRAANAESGGRDFFRAVQSNATATSASVQGQNKDGQFSAFNEGPKEQLDLSASTASSSAAFSQRLSAQEAPAQNPAATPKGAAQTVGDQVLDSVRATLAGGDKQVMVRLNPPELGSVTVRFQEQGDQIRAVLEVSRQETRQEVERALPEVVRALQESGVQIRRVEVILSDPSGKDPGQSRAAAQQQDAGAGHQNFQQQADSPATWRATSDERGPSRIGYTNSTTERADSQGPWLTDRIDMLM